MKEEFNIILLEKINLKIVFWNEKNATLDVDIFNDHIINKEECLFILNHLITNYTDKLTRIVIDTNYYNSVFNEFSDLTLDSEDFKDAIYLVFNNINKLKIKLEQYRIENLIENF
jgi:hypothetical protein